MINAYIASIVVDVNLLCCLHPGAYNNRALHHIIGPVGDVSSANCSVYSSRHTGHQSFRLHCTSASVDVIPFVPRSSPSRRKQNMARGLLSQSSKMVNHLKISACMVPGRLSVIPRLGTRERQVVHLCRVD
jgi:hypothetical protein